MDFFLKINKRACTTIRHTRVCEQDDSDVNGKGCKKIFDAKIQTDFLTPMGTLTAQMIFTAA